MGELRCAGKGRFVCSGIVRCCKEQIAYRLVSAYTIPAGRHVTAIRERHDDDRGGAGDNPAGWYELVIE